MREVPGETKRGPKERKRNACDQHVLAQPHAVFLVEHLVTAIVPSHSAVARAVDQSVGLSVRQVLLFSAAEILQGVCLARRQRWARRRQEEEDGKPK